MVFWRQAHSLPIHLVLARSYLFQKGLCVMDQLLLGLKEDWKAVSFLFPGKHPHVVTTAL